METTPTTIAASHTASISTTHPRFGADTPLDIDAALASLRVGENGHAAQTLVKQDALRVVVVSMIAGARIAEHAANGQASIEGLRGRILIRTPSRVVELRPGRLLVLAPGERHAVAALSDGAFLLTITSPVA